MSKSSHAVRVLLHRIGVDGPARSRAFGGTGASPSGPRGRGPVLPVALAAVTMALAFTVGAAPVSASGVLQIEPELKNEAVYATRAHIEVEVATGTLELKWHGEYATSESGPWIAAGSGTTEKQSAGSQNEFPLSYNIFLGVGDENRANAALRHLTPSTVYYARFHVENSAHETAEKTFKFTTTAVAKPELIGAGCVSDQINLWRRRCDTGRSDVADDCYIR